MLSGRALGLVILAGAAVFAVIIFLPGLDRGTRLAASFIFAPVVVTPVIGAQAKVTPEQLLVGAVLGGGIAAVLYGTGQGGRFGGWLFAIELVALLLASRTLHVLRAAPETVVITLVTAVPLALVPAAIRQALLRGRRPPSRTEPPP